MYDHDVSTTSLTSMSWLNSVYPLADKFSRVKLVYEAQQVDLSHTWNRSYKTFICPYMLKCQQFIFIGHDQFMIS